MAEKQLKDKKWKPGLGWGTETQQYINEANPFADHNLMETLVRRRELQKVNKRLSEREKENEAQN